MYNLFDFLHEYIYTILMNKDLYHLLDSLAIASKY